MIATQFTSPGQSDFMSDVKHGRFPSTVELHNKYTLESVCYIVASLRHKVQVIKISSSNLF